MMRFFIINICFFLTFSAHAGYSNLPDSIGIERVGNQIFVLHQVEEKETLYSLGKRYNTHIKDIVSTNPRAEFGLEIGQVLKIPITNEKESAPKDGRIVHRVKPQETLYSISKIYEVKPEEIKEWNRISTNILDIGQKLVIFPEKSSLRVPEVPFMPNPDPEYEYTYHTVALGETLYSLSRNYDVPLDQLRSWNNLAVNDISVDQRLIVGQKPKQKENVEIRSMPADSDSSALLREVVYADITPPLSRENVNFDEVEESGMAELIQDSSNNRKYLALHRTAKIGTIMRVRNEMNGQEVFVRIIGTLPDNGANRNVLLKISRSAYDQLGAIDARFRVTISFIP